MIGWGDFIWFAVTAILLWMGGAVCSVFKAGKCRISAISLSAAGTAVYMSFIICYWVSVGHTPMQSMGETRLWYSLFVSMFGLLVYIRFPYGFLLPFTAMMASVFSIINILKPELQSQGLPAALQSEWFLPHVSIYMVAYAMTAIALIFGCVSIFNKNKADEHMKVADRLAAVASLLLLSGMLSGAVWAKEAWGDWWAWDAKENWAAATWFLTLVYLHLQVFCYNKRWIRVLVLLLAFIFLQITWYGVDSLPAAQESMHTYSRN